MQGLSRTEASSPVLYQCFFHTQHLKHLNDCSAPKTSCQGDLLLLPRAHTQGFGGESCFLPPPQEKKQGLALLSVF